MAVKDDQVSSGSSDASFDPLNPEEDEEGWEDEEPDVEDVQIKSLFDEKTFSDAMSMVRYCKDKYDFDFGEVQNVLGLVGLDSIESIKLVNYIRKSVATGDLKPDVSSKAPFADDSFMMPALEDDAFLWSLDDVAEAYQSQEKTASKGKEATSTASGGDPVARVAELEAQLRALQAQFENYRETVVKTLDERWSDQSTSNSENTRAGSSGVTQAKPLGAKEEANDDGYFESYSYNSIHETMLKDAVRTDAYRDFIYENKHLFAGKTVLDIGCGTGILSMFCAKAGAAKVIAVDNSAIIDKARQNVLENGFGNVITCVRGKIEEVTLPVKQVDIIVSEWMGYCLLYEAMLDSVIWARDRYLKPDGLMVPSHTTLHLAPLADPDLVADLVAFWHEVYGFSMKAMLDGIYDDALLQHPPQATLAGESCQFIQLPLHDVSVKDLQFERQFTVELAKDIESLDGWCIWFDTFFLTSREERLAETARADPESWKTAGTKGTAFTTGPAGKETHWQCGVLQIKRNHKPGQPLSRGTKLNGIITFKKGKDAPRELDIEVQWDATSEKGKQMWHMR